MPAPAHLQRHIAYTSVAPTTLRNMLPVGGRTMVCDYLAVMDLSAIDPRNYAKFLDGHTDALSRCLGGERTWGPARKALNLFMRNMAYNHLMRAKYKLDLIEAQLELPLDSRTMRAISAQRPGLRVVRVVNLDVASSQDFQNAATEIGREQGTDRVHLDLEWWTP